MIGWENWNQTSCPQDVKMSWRRRDFKWPRIQAGGFCFSCRFAARSRVFAASPLSSAPTKPPCYAGYCTDCAARRHVASLKSTKSLETGDIYFRIYDDVTDNSILGLQRNFSIRNAFAQLLFWFLLFIPREKKHQTNKWNKRKMTCVSATQRKICRKWIQRLCFLCTLSGVVFEFLQISGI